MANQTVKVVFDGKDNTGKAIKSLRGNLDNANKAVGKIKSSLGGMTGALGVAAGAAGFGLLAKNALQTADNLAKTSTRLGLAAKDMASLQLAANYAGVETEAFSKLMEIFQKRVGEAAEGTGQASEILGRFGISAEKLATLPLDKQLAIIADEFKNLKNPAERAAAASDLFSNRGIKLLNFLDNGSEGLDDLRAEFKRLGLEIDDNALGQIESFNDSVTRFQGIVQAAMVKGLSEAAPQMENVAQKLAEMAVPLTGKLLNGFQFLLDNLGLITKLFAGFIAVMAVTRVVQFATALIQLGKALATVRVAAIAAQASLGPIGIAMGAIGTAAAFFSDDLAALGSDMMDLGKDSDDLTDETDNLAGSIDDLQEVIVTATRRPLPNFQKEIKKTAKEEVAATSETDEFREAIEKLRKEIKNPRDLVDFQKKVDALNKSFEEITGTSEEVAAAQAAIVEEITGIKSPIVEAKREVAALEGKLEALRNITNKSDGVVEAIGALEDKLEDAKSKVEDLAGSDGVRLIENYYDAIAKGSDSGGAIDQLNEALSTIKGATNDAFSKQAINGYFEAIENGADSEEALKNLKGALDEIKSATNDAFSKQAIQEYFNAIKAGTEPGEALEKLKEKLGEAETAAGQLFGVPMLNKIRGFFDAIGAGASGEGAIGLLNGALTDLEGAFAEFFTSGDLKFSSFVENIIDGLKRIAAEAIVSVGLNFVKNIIPGLNTGGQVEGFAVGGRVTGPGGPTEDRVPAMLSPGEFVIRANSVSKFGAGFFEALNAGVIPKDMIPGYNLGGFITKFLAGPYAWVTGGGYTLDNSNFWSYLMDLYEALSQVDPREDPLEAYDKAMEYVVNLIGHAISEAMGKIEEVFGGSVFGDGMLGEYMGGILGPIGALDPQDFLNKFKYFNTDEFTGGLRDSIFDHIFAPINDMIFSLPDFNMDEEFARMYMGASSVVNREFGGPLERGQASIVGENGPELFLPDRRGNVSPISKDGGRELIAAVREVKSEVAALRRQMDRQNPVQLAGGRK